MPEEKQEQEKPKKSSKLKLFIILFVAILILGGGGFFAYIKFFKPPGEGEEAVSKKTGKQPVMHKLDTFLVNLSDPGGKRYLKLTMELELENQKVLEEIQKDMSKIRDVILVILSSKEYDDISTVNGKIALKKEILTRVNGMLGNGKVINIYFTEFLVQ